MFRRKPDFVIGDPAAPYLRRWWIIPRNRFFNIYLHHILRSDDDRALHDHPWWNVSIILKGGYQEIVFDDRHQVDFQYLALKAGFSVNVAKTLTFTCRAKWRRAGSVVCRRPKTAHRLALLTDGKTLKPIPCWTLFITGPRMREWGFYCLTGWKHWREFTGVPQGMQKGDERGPGCSD